MNERLNTRDLVELLAARTGMDKKRADIFIGALSSYISKGIEKNKIVKVLGLGTFKVVLVRERESVHIQTGERFIIPAHHKLSFVPNKDFKEHINRPFAFLEPVEAIEEHKPKKVVLKKDDAELSEQKEHINPVADAPETTVVDTPKVPVTPLVANVEEKISDLGGDVVEVPAVNSAEKQIGGDYFTDEEYELYSKDNLGKEDEQYVSEELESELPQTEDFDENVTIDEDAEYTDSVSIDDSYKEDNGEDNDEEFEEEEEEEELEEEEEYERILEKNIKKDPLWMRLIMVPLPIFLATILTTYLFLHYNTDRTSNNNAAYDNKPATGISMPGEFELNNDFITDTITSSDGFILSDSSESNYGNERLDSIGSTKEDTLKDKKSVMDFIALSSESPKPGPKRADKPNEEIERKNRELPKTANSKTETASNKATSTAATEAAAKEKVIPKTIRLTAGTSLRQIAQEYYGDRAFWVYIYEYNKDRIKNYNNIPVGTEIRLPLPRTYGINSKSASSIQKAEQKQSELYRNSPKN